jgi:putative redox protein
MAQPHGKAPISINDEDGGRWVVTRGDCSGYRADVTARTHTFAAGEPVALGGSDAGPTPYEFFLGALGSCMVMTLRMYADRKGWPLESAEVRLRIARSHARDCENLESSAVGITHIERKMEFHGALSDEQREQLLQIADRCPVKQSIERGIAVQSI